MSDVLERAKRRLRPSKQATAEGWARLQARIEDPDDVPELPRVPAMVDAGRSWRPWAVAAIAIAAAAALWFAIGPQRFVASEVAPQQQAPDRVDAPEPAPTQEHVEVRAPVVEAQPSEVPAPFATAPEPSKPRVRASPTPVKESDVLAAELALLRAAKRALASGNPEAALASVREHARRHPNGELAEERWATHVRALCALDRREEAARVASQFAAARPASTVARALRDDPCANKL